MAQTIFLQNNVDPQQVNSSKEIRQSVPFPLNGKHLLGPGSDPRMNSYVGGLFQPINFNNNFDPVNNIDVPLTGSMGITTIHNHKNNSIKTTLDAPVYCLGSSQSLYVDKFRDPMANTLTGGYPQSISPLSPFNASYAPANTMVLIGLGAVTKIPFYNGYCALAVYSDLEIMPSGMQNINNLFRKGADDTSNFFSGVEYFFSYYKYFLDGNIQFPEKYFGSLPGVKMYSCLVILNDDLSVVQVLNFKTNYMDQRAVGRSNDIKRGDMPIHLVPADYSLFNVTPLRTKSSNNTVFDYNFKDHYLGQVFGLSAAAMSRIKENINKGVSSKDAVRAELESTLLNSLAGSVNYGNLNFATPEKYNKDANSTQTAQNRYLDWLTSEFAGMQLLHITFPFGRSKINFGCCYNNNVFYDIDNLPKTKISVYKFSDNVTWTYPVSYAFDYFNDGKTPFMGVSYFFYAYMSSTNNQGYMYETGDLDASRANSNSFMFNGAEYDLSPSGDLFFSLPGASPTTPFCDESFLSQGSCVFFNYDRRHPHQSTIIPGAYFWDITTWGQGFYPFPYPLIKYGGSIQQPASYFNDHGGAITMWLNPVGIKEREM